MTEAEQAYLDFMAVLALITDDTPKQEDLFNAENQSHSGR